MIELRVGWYAPHRAGGWRRWFLDFYCRGTRQAPTASANICILGVSILVMAGWGNQCQDDRGEGWA